MTERSISDIKQIKEFNALLGTIDAGFTTGSAYPGKYLEYLLEHKEYFTRIYADVLIKLLHHSKKEKKEIVLIDYGAGNGILGMFAKYSGFKKVFIVDTDPAFIEAARLVADKLAIRIDGFITGDVNTLDEILKSDIPDAVVGTDVIEHIYNLTDFFIKLHQLNPHITSVFTTGSNPSSYFKVRKLRKLQLKDEYHGGSPDDSVLFGENAHPPYLKIREKIISDSFSFTSEEIALLAKNTRGLNSVDIMRAVTIYKSTGKLPVPLTDPYNTCNPLTGSWTERILTINAYCEIYKNAGFELNLSPGFYDENARFPKNLRNRILNYLVKSMGKTFAPYIVLSGFKN